MSHYGETGYEVPIWHVCAGCGGAAANLKDVSLVVGSGAEAPRRLVWEHPLCGLCQTMLLNQLIEKFCPAYCDKEHGEDTTK